MRVYQFHHLSTGKWRRNCYGGRLSKSSILTVNKDLANIGNGARTRTGFIALDVGIDQIPQFPIDITVDGRIGFERAIDTEDVGMRKIVK